MHLAGGVLFAKCITLFATAATAQQSGSGSVPVYVFWQEGCPHCSRATAALERIAARNTAVNLQKIESGKTPANDAAFAATVEVCRSAQAAVPLVIIGRQSFVGFFPDGKSETLYREAIRTCTTAYCPDVAGPLLTLGVDTSVSTTAQPLAGGMPESLDLPLLGEVRTRDLSLPLLTVSLAAIDGFNPCAMWVLVFLIGLLLGLNDQKRMWTLGIAFLVATAFVCFAILAAWLNIIPVLGAIVWVRTAIGILAIGAGAYFLREYWGNPDRTCRITRHGRRHKIMAAFRSVVEQNSLLLGILGIVALAVAVNLIELLCSADLPAVYTQVLALSPLSPWGCYAYLGLYVPVFLLDDLAVFATAMVAVQVTGLTGLYALFAPDRRCGAAGYWRGSYLPARPSQFRSDRLTNLRLTTASGAHTIRSFDR